MYRRFDSREHVRVVVNSVSIARRKPFAKHRVLSEAKKLPNSYGPRSTIASGVAPNEVRVPLGYGATRQMDGGDDRVCIVVTSGVLTGETN